MKPLPQTLPGAAQSAAAASLFDQVRALEHLFPVPVPEAAIEMGTFHAVSGHFQGVVSTLQKPEDLLDEDLDAPLDKIEVKVAPTVSIDAVEAILEFRVSPPGAHASFTVAGVSVIAGAAGVVRVHAGRVGKVDWVAQSQGRIYRDTVRIQRPPVIGAGAFTLPVLPMAIAYEPPQDQLRRNSASYAVTRSTGTRLSAHFERESSVSAPEVGLYLNPDPSRFADLMALKQAMQVAASGIQALADTGPLATAAAALSTLAGLLGNAVSTDGQSTVDSATGTLSMIDSSGLQVSPTARLGPGQGDLFVFMRQARLVWLSTTTTVRLALLEAGPIAMASAQSLADGSADFGLTPELTAALLALDPFVTDGPSADLPPTRYRFLQGFELGPGSSLVHTHSFTIGREQTRSITRIRTLVHDFEASQLAFFGIGPAQTETVTSAVSNQSSTSTAETTTISAQLQLHNDAQAPYGIGVYYDSVFGTLAFREVPLASRAQVSGRLLNRRGQPRSNQRVELRAGAQHWCAVTDAKGGFTFSAIGLKAGPLSLHSGGRLHRQLVLQGQALRGIELRE